MREKENQDWRKRRRVGLRNGFTAPFWGGKERENLLSWESPPSTRTHIHARVYRQAHMPTAIFPRANAGHRCTPHASMDRPQDYPQTYLPDPYNPTHRNTYLYIHKPTSTRINPFEHITHAHMHRRMQTVTSPLSVGHTGGHTLLRSVEPQLDLCTESPLSLEIPATTQRGDQLLRA